MIVVKSYNETYLKLDLNKGTNKDDIDNGEISFILEIKTDSINLILKRIETTLSQIKDFVEELNLFLSTELDEIQLLFNIPDIQIKLTKLKEESLDKGVSCSYVMKIRIDNYLSSDEWKFQSSITISNIQDCFLMFQRLLTQIQSI